VAAIGRGCALIARLCLLAAIVLLPWFLGGVEPFSQVFLFAFLLTAQTFSLLAHLVSQERLAISGAALAGLGLIALGLMQTVELQRDVGAQWSPKAFELREQLLGNDAERKLVTRDSTSGSASALSLYPPETRRSLGVLICGLATFVMAGQLFVSTPALLTLTTFTAVNAVALAFFGLVQKLTWNGAIYRVVPVETQTVFGPFVNRNAGGGYLVLSLAALIPLVAWVAEKRRNWGSADNRSWGTPGTIVLCLVLMTATIVAGILASMSRGAWLGALVGVGLTVIAAVPRHLKGRVLFAVLGVLVLAAGLLTSLELSSELGNRLTHATGSSAPLETRLQLWRDLESAVSDFWRTGSGLGTFGLVQPLYQSAPMTVWHSRAENMFLEVLVEAGAGGLALTLMLLAAVAWSTVRLLRGSQTTFDVAVGSMGALALSSQAVCALFDFGVSLPATLLLLAAVTGAVVGRSARLSAPSARSASALAYSGALVLGVGGIVGLTWGRHEAAWAASMDVVLDRGEIDEDERALTLDEIEESLQAIEIVLNHRPGDAEASLRAAELHVVRYRHRALAQLLGELGGSADANALWGFTSPMVLHQRAVQFASSADAGALDELRSNLLIREELVPAVRFASAARSRGPLFPRAHQLLAQLCFLYDDPRQDEEGIARAVLLRPQSPAIRFWSGMMHWHSRRLPEACAEWRLCLSQSDEFDERILSLASPELTPDAIVSSLLPARPEVLERVANRQESAGDFVELQEVLGRRMKELVPALERDRSSDGPSDPQITYWSGLGALWTGEVAVAVEQFGDAVRRDPANVEWRLRYAGALRDLGELQQALRETMICLRVDPDHGGALQLMTELVAADRKRHRGEPKLTEAPIGAN
jgi:tetratricopeptide (TPR) repeat protein